MCPTGIGNRLFHCTGIVKGGCPPATPKSAACRLALYHQDCPETCSDAADRVLGRPRAKARKTSEVLCLEVIVASARLWEPRHPGRGSAYTFNPCRMGKVGLRRVFATMLPFMYYVPAAGPPRLLLKT